MHAVHVPTMTQYALAACFLVLGPTFGLLAAIFAHAGHRSRPLAFLVATGVSWVAWIVSCVVAVVLFPGYPIRNAPPEWVAISFTIPGLIAGGLASAHARRDVVLTPRARGAVALVVSSALFASAMLVEGHRQLTMWPARRHLPTQAVVLREEIVEDGFLPDFTYAMDATMTREEFEAWMRELGLSPCAPSSDWCRPDAPNDEEWGARGSYDGRVGHFRAWES